MAVMEEGDAGTVHDKEVEEWEEGATASTIPETGAIDITLDLEDAYLEFDDKSSGTHKTPVAALTPVSIVPEEILTSPIQPSLKKPQVEKPAPELVVISELVPDYPGIPLWDSASHSYTRLYCG